MKVKPVSEEENNWVVYLQLSNQNEGQCSCKLVAPLKAWTDPSCDPSEQSGWPTSGSKLKSISMAFL